MRWDRFGRPVFQSPVSYSQVSSRVALGGNQARRRVDPTWRLNVAGLVVVVVVVVMVVGAHQLGGPLSHFLAG